MGSRTTVVVPRLRTPVPAHCARRQSRSARDDSSLSFSGRNAAFTIVFMLELSTPVQYVKGVGPRIAEMLAAKGVQTLEDLLFYLPFRYEDRLNPRTVAELRAGEMASVIAEVRTSFLFRTRNRMPLFEMTGGQGRA